ncbi:uncharacterized protein LOC103701320 isoform X2 [Phoenix dactylifera]|uniref:Uncharacterized protein LOC103701320 isoform X2 n=1 Tax=Phoenix dactylifera TaxID=42345 RepID=A0A8B9AU75_PHODC|nr:uncharacterized protein LOC103701320 isoform X2 [Phoenix dactylifera]
MQAPGSVIRVLELVTPLHATATVRRRRDDHRLSGRSAAVRTRGRGGLVGMEDIEDVVAAGALPELRLPLTAVGVKPKKKPRACLIRDLNSNSQIPGTQVGHTKGYIQVLVIASESMLGTSTDVKITSVGRWSVFGEVIETHSSGNINLEAAPCQEDSCESCACSREPEPCPCTVQNLGQQIGNGGHEETPIAMVMNSSTTRYHIGGTFISALQSMQLRKRKLQGPVKMNDVNANKFQENQKTSRMSGKLATMDWILLSGMIVSFLTTIALVILLSSRMLSS